MAFERAKFSGLGITLRGPEEHIGEHRYSWMSTNEGRTNRRLAIRIEKVSGNGDEHISPVVEFYFAGGNLIVDPRRRQVMNPYLNCFVQQSPYFAIPLDLLRLKTYEIATWTSWEGDFVLLHGERKQQVHFVALNISALGLLEGTDRVCLDGTFGAYDGTIGTLAPSDGTLLPFFTSGSVGHGEQRERLQQFVADSHAVAVALMHRAEFGSSLVKRFVSISMGVYSDRGGLGMSEGRTQASEVFGKLFADDRNCAGASENQGS